MLRLLLLLILAVPIAAAAQPSPQSAFGRSLLVPGLGHRAVQGDWDGAASAFALADGGLWLGLAHAVWRRGDLTRSYQTLAAAGADADVEGKDRRFFLQLATYRSSDAYREAQLRARAWESVEYVADPAYRWAWEDERDYLRFRSVREDAEAARRRVPVLAGLLVANRLVAGVLSVRSAGRADRAPRAPRADLRLSAPPPDGRAPVVHLRVNF